VVTFTPAVAVDWNDNGSFSDANEAVTANVLRIRTKRGRTKVGDKFAPGSMTVTLDNQSGLYSPHNSGGALFGSLLPGRVIKAEVTDSVPTTHGVFYGYITSYRESIGKAGQNVVVIQAKDAFDRLRFGSMRLALQESQRPDELITTILDDISWPAGLRALDTSTVTVGQFWQHRATPISALQEAAHSEPGAQFFAAKDGRLTFKTRNARSLASSLTTLTDPEVIGFDVRREDLYDEVHHVRPGLDVDTATTVLFTDSPGDRQLQSGSTHPDNTIHVKFTNAGKAVVTPASSTDYTANTVAGGGGVDKTAQVSVSSITKYGGGASITFANADSSAVFLRGPSQAGMQIRGQAVREANDERRYEKAVASPVVTNQVLQDTWQYYDDSQTIADYADFRANALSTARPRIKVTKGVGDDTSANTLLSAELGSKITLTNTTGLYPTQVNDTYHVEAIEWDISPGFGRVSWTLFQVDLAVGSFFIIESGGTLSTIGTGNGRIAF